MNWIPINKKKPKPNQQVMIFRQGYGDSGNYWSHYDLAYYMKNPNNKRRMVFGSHLDDYRAWLHSNVTHWMPLPPQPEKLEK